MYLANIPIIEIFIRNCQSIKQPIALITHNSSPQDIRRLKDYVNNLYHIERQKRKIDISYLNIGLMLIPYDGSVYGWYISSKEDLESKYFNIQNVENIYYIAENRMINYMELEMLIKGFDKMDCYM